MNEPFPLWLHTGAILTAGHRSAPARSAERVPMWDRKTRVEHVLRAFLRVCQNVVIVGECTDLDFGSEQRVQTIEFSGSNPNPLAWLDTVLSGGRDTQYLVATCDQPFLTVPLLSRLTEGRPESPHLFMIPRGTSFHPFPGYYPASILPSVERVLSSDKPDIRELIHQVTPLWVPLSEREEYHLLSINSPDQLGRLQRLSGNNTVSY